MLKKTVWEICEASLWHQGRFNCGCCGKKTTIKPQQNFVICPKCKKEHRLNRKKHVEHKAE